MFEWVWVKWKVKDNHLLGLSVIAGSCPCLSGMYVCVRERERERVRESEREWERETERQKDGWLAFKWADGIEPISLTLCLSFFSLWHFSPSSLLRVISWPLLRLPQLVVSPTRWHEETSIWFPFVILKKKRDIQKDKRGKKNTYSYRMIHSEEETNGTFLKNNGSVLTPDDTVEVEWWTSRIDFFFLFFLSVEVDIFSQMNSSLQGSPSLSDNLS